ncbi:xanthine dehydrogenase family protein molybdopterin-binding subunit [Chloroflexota bacterium]
MREKIEDNNTYMTVGKRIPRVDARDKVCGLAEYVDDVCLPQMLYGATLKSAYGHAIIRSIDTSKAGKLPGVRAVITGKDIADRCFCFCAPLMPGLEDKLPLERDKVRYIGDEVAAVAAVDLETAEQALALIKVEYEVLPLVLDPEKAIKPGAPRVHDKERNISVAIKWDFGEIDRGFKEADYIFENRFSTSQQSHSCLEPQSCIASWGEDGRLTVWSSTQLASVLQRELAAIMGIPYGDVRVIKPSIGGSFGGKQAMHSIVPIAAYLAKKAGQPVKIVYDRGEEFVSSRTRHPAIIELKTGVRKDGTLTAREARIIQDNGAYNDQGPAVLHEIGTLLCSYYRVPNARVNGYLVYTNKPYGGAFRGFGNPQAAFAVESQMDIIARKLNVDPVDIRLINAYESGDTTACGWKITSCGLKECIQRAADAIGWKDKRGKGNYRGLGIAACIHWGGGIRAGESDYGTTIVEINSGGQVYVFTAATDLGQGTDTEITQIVAEELGVNYQSVKLIPQNTDICPSFCFVGSPGTFIGGGAAKAAAADAKTQLLAVVAEMKSVNISDLDISGGHIYYRRSGEKFMSVSEVSHFSYEIKGVPIIGRGRFDLGPTQFDMETGGGQLSPTYSFAAQAVELEVDPVSSHVTVLNCVTALDAGVVINPLMVEGQVEGGVAQGIGYALTEGLVIDSQGKVPNNSFSRYKILRAQDIPRRIDTIILATSDPRGPFGAKAIGEAVMIPTAPAVANALNDAVDIRITELPMTPDKVFEAMG